MDQVSNDLHVVQFCPCGCVSYMTKEEIITLDGENQLNDTNKLDAPIFHSSKCPDCLEHARRRNANMYLYEMDFDF